MSFFSLSPSTHKELLEFLKSLPLYCVIKSDIPNYNSYAVAHAMPPRNAMTEKNIPTLGRIISEDKYKSLRSCLTYRKENDENISLPDRGVITIIGHTPVGNSNGFIVSENNKLLIIDGVCAYMAYNADSQIFLEMATLIVLSDEPGRTRVCLYVDDKTKELRDGMEEKNKSR